MFNIYPYNDISVTSGLFPLRQVSLAALKSFQEIMSSNKGGSAEGTGSPESAQDDAQVNWGAAWRVSMRATLSCSWRKMFFSQSRTLLFFSYEIGVIMCSSVITESLLCRITKLSVQYAIAAVIYLRWWLSLTLDCDCDCD